MPNPVPFSKNLMFHSTGSIAHRLTANYPGGFSTLYFELNIPITAEYEDAKNTIDWFLVVNGAAWGHGNWVGGRRMSKKGEINPPPSFQSDIRSITVGATVDVHTNVGGSGFTFGVQNGLIS